MLKVENTYYTRQRNVILIKVSKHLFSLENLVKYFIFSNKAMKIALTTIKNSAKDGEYLQTAKCHSNQGH